MRKLTDWLPAIVWMGVIYYLSSRTSDEMGGWLSVVQKWVPFIQGFDWGHFAAYFILALTYAWGMRRNGLSWANKSAVVLLCVLYGLTDEYHQMFVGGRTPDLTDIRNDAIGAVLAMLFITIPAVRKRMKF
jgi:VanZ family protein